MAQQIPRSNFVPEVSMIHERAALPKDVKDEL